MSDDNNISAQQPQQAVDPVQQLLHGANGVPGQPLTTDQRNERREALLKRQREAREKAQQISQTARANAVGSSSASNSAGITSASPAPANATAAANTLPAHGVSTPAPAPASVPTPTPIALDTPVRENMVQQAVSFLSSPSVQSADESKKTQFLEKKGLTAKEIELARARIAGSVSAPAVSSSPAPAQQPYQSQVISAPNGSAPPPVPPRTYAPLQPYVHQPMYIPQQPQPQAVVDPNAFKKKLLMAMLISGGVTVLTSIIVQKLIYPMVRGITGARQTLAVTQAELLSKLKEKLSGYKEYLVGLHLGSNRTRVKRTKDDGDAAWTTTKDTATTVEDEDGQNKKTATTTANVNVKEQQQQRESQLSTVRQLDAFQKKLESHADSLNFEQLKATRAMTQDLAEYITKETYALSSSIAYPTSRYYGYNTAGAAASGKGGLADPTTPESALKSEIRSLKGLLLNWRNFPVAKEGAAPAGQANGYLGLPNLVQQQ